MNDITLVYYTASVIPEFFANNVRNHLLKSSEGKPIISVSQKPLDFGENICLGEIGQSVFNVYVQILEGAKRVKTKYLACCEDDTLYVPEHFEHQPPDGTISFNCNFWRLNNHTFYFLYRRGMCVCMSTAEIMVETLENRFRKFPTPESAVGVRKFGEPGRFERSLRLPRVPTEQFETAIPVITVRHREGLAGDESAGVRYKKQGEIPYWGKSLDLWKEIHG